MGARILDLKDLKFTPVCEKQAHTQDSESGPAKPAHRRWQLACCRMVLLTKRRVSSCQAICFHCRWRTGARKRRSHDPGPSTRTHPGHRRTRILSTLARCNTSSSRQSSASMTAFPTPRTSLPKTSRGRHRTINSSIFFHFVPISLHHPCRPPPRSERRRHGVDDAVLTSAERGGLAETCPRERCRHSRRAKRLCGGTYAAPGISHS